MWATICWAGGRNSQVLVGYLDRSIATVHTSQVFFEVQVCAFAASYDMKYFSKACEIAFATLGFNSFQEIHGIASSNDCQTFCQKNAVSNSMKNTQLSVQRLT